MAKPNVFGIRRVIKATGYSMNGLSAAWKNEQAFRQELFLAVVFVPLGWWLGNNGVERALLIGSCLFVLVVELVNSAIEAVVDRFGPEQHELSGRAKDLGSAAVMISLLATVVIWLLVVWERLF